MESDNDQIKLLLFNSIIGKLTTEQQQVLDEWRAQSQANEKLYQRLMDIKRLERNYHRRQMVNISRPLKEMRRRINAAYASSRVKTLGRVAVAAVVAVVVICGVLLIPNSLWQTPSTEVVTDLPQIHPGETKATLSVEGGQEVFLGKNDSLNKELMKAIPSTPSSELATVSRQLCLDVPRGGEFKIVLEDSTEVWLNSESKLLYPETFADAERKVTVQGEVYFKVAHEDNRPFIVESDGQLVCVYGTEFNLRSYQEDEQVYTTLINGSVSLSKVNGDGGELLLTPGHQAQFNKQTEVLTVKSVNTDVVASWRNGRFVFEEQDLEHIMRDLSRWYAFTYQFDNPLLSEIVFMGSIPRYADFNTALTILEKSGGLRFEVEGTTVRILPSAQ